MKKVRVFVITVVIALMAMGVGYAMWSQTLTINVGGSMGTFKVIIKDAYVINGAGDCINGGDKAEAVVTKGGDEASLTANKLVPDEYHDYKVIFTNVGDCTAALNQIRFEPKKSAGNGKSNVACVPEKTNDILIRVDGGDWHSISSTYTIKIFKNIKPGDTASIVVRIFMDGDAGLSENEKFFKVKITPTFIQQ